MNWYKNIKIAISPTEFFQFNQNNGIPNWRQDWAESPREQFYKNVEDKGEPKKFAFHGLKVKMDKAYDIIDSKLMLQAGDNYIEVPFSLMKNISYKIEDFLSENSIQPHKDNEGENEIWTYSLDSPVSCTIFFKNHEPIDIMFNEGEVYY